VFGDGEEGSDMATGVKRCGKCRREKPLTEFHRNGTSPDGHHRTCKVCRGIQRQKYREHHGYDIPVEKKPDPENRPELVPGRCWMPGCFRPELEDDVVCAYHHATFVEEGARA
jgi:hypothetical protein